MMSLLDIEVTLVVCRMYCMNVVVSSCYSWIMERVVVIHTLMKLLVPGSSAFEAATFLVGVSFGETLVSILTTLLIPTATF